MADAPVAMTIRRIRMEYFALAMASPRMLPLSVAVMASLSLSRLRVPYVVAGMTTSDEKPLKTC